jgi:hypothetical protein
VSKIYFNIINLLCLIIDVVINKTASYAEDGIAILFILAHNASMYLFPAEIPLFKGIFRKNYLNSAGGFHRIFNMKYNISLKEFVIYDKRNYYQFIHYADTRSHHRRWELSRLFC